MTSPTATVLMVFGRGVLGAGERYALTPASTARVRAVIDHVAAHRNDFSRAAANGRQPRIIFTGGWAEACAGAPPPPAGFREGDLMLRQAEAAGLHRYADLRVETRSRSTLENLLHTLQDGLLADRAFTARDPLGIVSHAAHLPRIRYLAGKVLRLRGTALLDVPAIGGEVPSARRSERAVHLASRLCFLGVEQPAGLLRRERRMVALMRRLEQLAGHRPVAWQGEIGDVLSDASARW